MRELLNGYQSALRTSLSRLGGVATGRVLVEARVAGGSTLAGLRIGRHAPRPCSHELRPPARTFSGGPSRRGIVAVGGRFPRLGTDLH
jgi:hypothetical protein